MLCYPTVQRNPSRLDLGPLPAPHVQVSAIHGMPLEHSAQATARGSQHEETTIEHYNDPTSPAQSCALTSLPSEILLKIFQQSDLQTLVKLLLVSKGVNRFIKDFEDSIALPVALLTFRRGNFWMMIGGTMPTGFRLLKHMLQLRVATALDDQYCSIFNRSLQSSFTRPSEDGFMEIWTWLESACEVAWRLCDIYTETQITMKREPDTREAAYHKLLHEEATQKQLAYIKEASATSLLDFRVLYIIRGFARFGGSNGLNGCKDKSDIGRRIVQNDPSLRPPKTHIAHATKKIYKQAREWASWYSVNECTPKVMLRCVEAIYCPTTLECVSHMDYESQRKWQTQCVSERYYATSAVIRQMQSDSAKSVLDAIDQKILKAGLRPNQKVPIAFNEMLRPYLRPYATQSMFKMNFLCPWL